MLQMASIILKTLTDVLPSVITSLVDISSPSLVSRFVPKSVVKPIFKKNGFDAGLLTGYDQMSRFL